jgi:WD40-like Beta Propeller Repeat
MRSSPLNLLLCVVLGLLLGCSATSDGNDEPAGGSTQSATGGNPGGDPIPGSLTITPNPISVTINGADQAVAFVVVSSSDGDVTSTAMLTLDDPTLATVTSGALVFSKNLTGGGKTTLRGTYRGQVGSAEVNVAVKAQDIIDPSAPPNPVDYFDNGDGGPAPSWVYPFSQTMLPRNQPELNFQFNGVAAAQAYRIRIDGPTYSQNIYLGPALCAGGTQCALQLGDMDWTAIAHSLAGTDATLTLSASAGPEAPSGSAPPHSLSFSPEDVEGGLYYWSTTITGIYRVPLGAKTATPFITNGNEFGCSGCHAVSRDGKKVALEFGSADGTGGGIVDGANGQSYIVTPPAAGQWNLQTFSPDGTMLMVNWQGHARVIDSTTGAELFDVPEAIVGGRLAQPEWSPDGTSIVFVRFPADGSGAEWMATNTGDIMVMPFNGGLFGPPQMIVQSIPNNEYHFYPSWTPDSKWIVFNTGTVPCGGFGGSGCNTYDPQNTRLRLVPAQPGQAPVELIRATHAMGQSTNWPRAAPFIQQDGNLIFFTFSSRFPYGFVTQGTSPQIWMAAVNLRDAEQNPNEDPSYAPFWMTFQNPAESNHLATWTTTVVCVDNDDCPDGFLCSNGKCEPEDVPE